MTRVFVLGNATVDVTMNVAAFPVPGETVLSENVRRGPGGKGLNQAVAASRTGADVVFGGAVGDDEAGGSCARSFPRRPASTRVGSPRVSRPTSR